ncbi:MAG: hypothetical protein KGH89_08175 [Thaumarchaeota archaeon]|nr:hypothetical protein [Nitrososphaerota archaeon]MDE1866730.1 hypothetical protein [Nitrososphaerota archaeon]
MFRVCSDHLFCRFNICNSGQHQFQGTRTPVNGTTYVNTNYRVQVAIPDGWSGAEIKRTSGSTSSTREHGGTGLGLSVCKGIIESHGGKIWAESGVNGGTQIHILLPVLDH